MLDLQSAVCTCTHQEQNGVINLSKEVFNVDPHPKLCIVYIIYLLMTMTKNYSVHKSAVYIAQTQVTQSPLRINLVIVFPVDLVEKKTTSAFSSEK